MESDSFPEGGGGERFGGEKPIPRPRPEAAEVGSLFKKESNSFRRGEGLTGTPLPLPWPWPWAAGSLDGTVKLKGLGPARPLPPPPPPEEVEKGAAEGR